ncbi:MAG: nucleotidyltransferase domain-containing protein [Chloroflexia bacterium]|nr:nucleotidyltransferase domain-containing protein [Chloroflexia bacterium]
MIDAAAYCRERDCLLSWIVNALRSDETVVAAWLGGSFGRGNADDLSDIDLWVVVEDDQINAIAAAPSAFVRALVRTIMEIEAPGNAPSGGAYLLTWIDGASGPQQVDWYVQSASKAVRPANTALLFERQPIPVGYPREMMSPEAMRAALNDAVRDSLLMAFIATKHARRGDPWTTASQLMHLAACIGTVEWLLEHGTSPAFDDRARSPLPNTIPATRDDQLAWIGASLGRLTALLNAQHPNTLSNLDAAIRTVERWLGAMDADRDQAPANLPGRPPGS